VVQTEMLYLSQILCCQKQRTWGPLHAIWTCEVQHMTAQHSSNKRTIG
jgi:hypothetical protein